MDKKSWKDRKADSNPLRPSDGMFGKGKHSDHSVPQGTMVVVDEFWIRNKNWRIFMKLAEEKSIQYEEPNPQHDMADDHHLVKMKVADFWEIDDEMERAEKMNHEQNTTAVDNVDNVDNVDKPLRCPFRVQNGGKCLEDECGIGHYELGCPFPAALEYLDSISKSLSSIATTLERMRIKDHEH